MGHITPDDAYNGYANEPDDGLAYVTVDDEHGIQLAQPEQASTGAMPAITCQNDR